MEMILQILQSCRDHERLRNGFTVVRDQVGSFPDRFPSNHILEEFSWFEERRQFKALQHRVHLVSYKHL